MTGYTTTLQDAYVAMQEASGIKVGDTVRVLRKAEDGKMGWTADWLSPCMDKCVGKTGVVEECDDVYGFQVRFPGDRLWYFPFFVLEKVAPAMAANPIPETVRAQAAAWFAEYDKHNHFPEMLALDAYAAGHAAAQQQQQAEIEALRVEVGALREALNLMVTTHDEGGWPTAAIVIARAALEQEAKP